MTGMKDLIKEGTYLMSKDVWTPGTSLLLTVLSAALIPA